MVLASDSAAPQSGCIVTWKDVPRVCASMTVFGACFGFGAGFAVLGASISQFAYSVGYEGTSLGNIFVYRGLGFLLGALLSMKALRIESINASKHLVCSLLIIIAGILLSIVPIVSSTLMGGDGRKFEMLWMAIVNSIFFVQGLCFGGIDAFSALAISEMWGQRTQPWMQAKNLFANFGALAGPSLVAAVGYERGYGAVGCLGFVSLVGIVAMSLYERVQPWLKLEPPDAELACAELSAISHTLHAAQDGQREGVQLEGDEECGQGRDGCTSPAVELTHWDELVVQVLEEVQLNRSNPTSPVKYRAAPQHDSATLQDQQSQSPTQSPPIRSERHVFDFAGSPRSGSPQRSAQPFLSTTTLLSDAVHSPLKRSTLSFASPKLARQVRSCCKPLGITFVPLSVRLLLAALAFFELGLLCAFGGWVGTYVEDLASVFQGEGDVESPEGAQEASAVVLTAFYAAQLLGSTLSVPTSAIFSATAIIRAQLALAVAGGVLLLVPYGLFGSVRIPYALTTAAASLLGLGLGCMYPLVMTIVNDYGATMTSNSTIAVVLGGCIGEAVAPFIVALAIARFGPSAFTTSMAALVAVMVLVYLALHYVLKHTDAVGYSDKMEQMHTRQSGSPRHIQHKRVSSFSPSSQRHHLSPNASTALGTAAYSPLSFPALGGERSPLSLSARSYTPLTLTLELPERCGPGPRHGDRRR